nr:hypothetical protein [bacterium]
MKSKAWISDAIWIILALAALALIGWMLRPGRAVLPVRTPAASALVSPIPSPLLQPTPGASARPVYAGDRMLDILNSGDRELLYSIGFSTDAITAIRQSLEEGGPFSDWADAYNRLPGWAAWLDLVCPSPSAGREP